MGYTLKQSQNTYPIVFGALVLSTDHITGATGKTLTVTISKNGGAFSAPSGAITEVGNGFYQIAANSTDTNTLGCLKVHATASGCDVYDEDFLVVGYDPFSALSTLTQTQVTGGAYALATDGSGNVKISAGSGAGQLDFTSGVVKSDLQTIKTRAVVDPGGSVTVPTSISSFAAGQNVGTATSVTGAVGSVTGNVGGNVVGSVGSVTGSVGSVTGNVGGNVVGSTASVTAPVTLTGGEHTNIATDVQTGLTAQGYTSARGGYLDTLNGLVAAIWSYAMTSAGALATTLIGRRVYEFLNALGTDYRVKVSADTHTSGETVAGVTGSVTVGSVTTVGTVTNPVTVGTINANAITASSLATDAAQEVATALLDLVDGVEPGETLRQFLRQLRGFAIGTSDPTNTTAGTVHFMRKDGTTVAVTVVYNANGARTSSTTGTV